YPEQSALGRGGTVWKWSPPPPRRSDRRRGCHERPTGRKSLYQSFRGKNFRLLAAGQARSLHEPHFARLLISGSSKRVSASRNGGPAQRRSPDSARSGHGTIHGGLANFSHWHSARDQPTQA